ncbi:MAG: hypothetical protein PHX83_01185 [Acidobacteriia bacterium]|nr:hypothetical protein [Terriglobia bacterium]
MNSIHHSAIPDVEKSVNAALFSSPKLQDPAARFSLGEFYSVWEGIQPENALILMYGDRCTTELAQRILQRFLLAQEPILILDACSDFSIPLFTRMAQRLGQGPEKFLRSIRMSRASTCNQVISLMDRVLEVSRKHKPALVVALGPMTPFYDERVARAEADRWFDKFRDQIHRLSEMGVQLLLACPETPSKRRPNYLEDLKSDALIRLVCERGTDSQVLLHLESPEEFKQSWSLAPNLAPSVRYSRQLRLF